MTDETKPRQPWTPGPWALGEENCGGGSNVRAVVTESAEGAVVGWTARVVIAGDEVVSDAAANANARLMAAAPAMAEALAALVGATTFTSTDAAAHELDSLDRGEFDSENDFERAKAELAHIVSANRVLDLCGWRRS